MLLSVWLFISLAVALNEHVVGTTDSIKQIAKDAYTNIEGILTHEFERHIKSLVPDEYLGVTLAEFRKELAKSGNE